MPIYFFDIDDGETSTRDNEGMDVTGPQEARKRAIAVLPSIAEEKLPNGDHHDFIVTVRDAGGEAVFRATLSLNAEWLVKP